MIALEPRNATVAMLAILLISAPVLAGGRSVAQHTAAVGITTVLRQPGTITGSAWHADNSPVSHALLRLRNVTTGRVVTGTQADAAGRFTFLSVASGSYLVELVDEGGRVKGIGQMFSVGPGEAVGTFIRLGAQVPWYSGFFSNAAAAALASAASLGVTAVGDGVQPASARF